MPRIDFRAARAQCRLADVLHLVGFTPSQRHGPQLRGPCPVHRSTRPASRSFAAHLGKGVWHGFHGGAGGNVLDLWATVSGQPLYQAVIELCERLGQEVPWLTPPAPWQPHEAPKEKTTMPDPRCDHADRAGELVAERRQRGPSAFVHAETDRWGR